MNNPEIDGDGNKFWRNSQGLLHREDGPAVEWHDGNKSWFINGQYHREDGPAHTWNNGGQSWWINGKQIT